MTPTPPSATLTVPEMTSRIAPYRHLLSSFTSSPSTFRILSSLSQNHSSKPLITPHSTLHILDSSFNPPTLAHLRIALSSLTRNPHPARLLLLLATQNADKAPKPASFQERLVMMETFGWEVLSQLGSRGEGVGVDIGVTKYPYFVDKSKAIEGEEVYRTNGEGIEQVHLIGYDTLTRLLSPRYYPPSHTLDSLVPFLGKHRLEVTYRTDDSWGDKGLQDGFVQGIVEGRLLVKDGMATEGEGEEGSLVGFGGKREWATEGRIVMVDGREEGEEVISSTKVREAAKAGDEERLGRLVPDGVGKFILEKGLYRDG